MAEIVDTNCCGVVKEFVVFEEEATNFSLSVVLCVQRDYGDRAGHGENLHQFEKGAAGISAIDLNAPRICCRRFLFMVLDGTASQLKFRKVGRKAVFDLRCKLEFGGEVGVLLVEPN